MKKQSEAQRLLGIFTNGLIRENPLLILMIGLCASLAVTTSVANGIGMGLAMTFVLLMSEIVISTFRKLIPASIRIPIFIIVVAAFTTVVDYILKAWFPALSNSMGVFIPLIVVNCIIMGRVEGFASKNPVKDVIPDALGMGAGFTIVLVIISAIRELLGVGTLLDFQIMPLSYEPIIFFILAPGGFFIFSILIALNLWLNQKAKKSAKYKADCENCSASGCMNTHCGIPEHATKAAGGE